MADDEIYQVCERMPRQPATCLAMRLLGAGVPLTLLMDLASSDGPDSRSIMAWEGSGGPGT
jgi:hypothetical protein